jgi:hypothetical protein
MVKIVRRIHLYTGLLLLPWVIFFGLSGVLFNHPEWLGTSSTVATLSADEVNHLQVQQPLEVNRMADEIVSRLNGRNGGTRYERDTGETPEIQGTITFQGVTDGEDVSVSLSPVSGKATVSSRLRAKEVKRPDFEGESFRLESFPESENKVIAGKILEDLGRVPVSELKLSDRRSVELRFQVRSIEDGQNWNLVYNAATGKLSGRISDVENSIEWGAILKRLHQLHGYPESVSARWLWSAFADATGMTMVFWGVSGLIMWWQMKPTRVLGIAGLSLAAVAALFVFTGTFKAMTFGLLPQKPESSRTSVPPVSDPVKGSDGVSKGIPGKP